MAHMPFNATASSFTQPSPRILCFIHKEQLVTPQTTKPLFLLLPLTVISSMLSLLPDQSLFISKDTTFLPLGYLSISFLCVC